MIPQHSAAPFRQQRWIELENIESLLTIPSFACVQIFDSYRPERTGGLTPSGGRTVLKVGLVARDNAPNVIINGPLAIPPLGKGYPGTMHDPMFSRVEAEYACGTTCGPITGEWFLKDGQKGYVALGDFITASPTGIQRVMRALDPDEFDEEIKILRCCLEEDHPGCGVVFEVKVGTWNPSTHGWSYGDVAKAIDWWHSLSGPYPGAGATGTFMERESEEYGVIWECIGNMSCDPDNCGECGGGY